MLRVALLMISLRPLLLLRPPPLLLLLRTFGDALAEPRAVGGAPSVRRWSAVGGGVGGRDGHHLGGLMGGVARAL